jgi:ferredoxin
MNRLYGWRYNPLYQSGALVLVLLAVLTVTGLYLLLFYRVGAPYQSVAGITRQVWLGRWIRGLHRYASDAAVLAVAVHAVRLFAQGRTWGPRALAWLSGLLLLFLIFVLGWTGYVMVWDAHGQLLAVEGARLLDALPIFAEPISRAFVGEAEVPSAFFFLNLFLHVALPVGLGLVLWIHVSRVARAGLLPPRKLMWWAIGLLVALSIFRPVSLAPPADPFRLPWPVPLDLFYAFWLPFTRSAPASAVWAGFVAVAGLLLAVPLLSRPRGSEKPAPSWVDEQHCTGCEQCYFDCPYEAITMIVTAGDGGRLVARVDPSLCVSCGICAGSCAPMRVGPPERTGRDQLAAVHAFVESHRPGAGDVVIVACRRSAAAVHPDRWDGTAIYTEACAGAVHTSVIEYLVRAGVEGVLVVACPPRDCWNREGAKWLEQRLYHDREAELQARVPRDRVRLVFANAAESGVVRRELRAFREALSGLEPAEAEEVFDLARLCEPAERGAER